MSTRDDDQAEYLANWCRIHRDWRTARWKLQLILGACVVAVVLLVAHQALGAVKSTKVDSPTVVLKRGSTTVKTFATMEQCRAEKPSLITSDGQAKQSGSGVYDCIYTERSRIAFGPNPVPVLGSVTITWKPPTTNADGTPLTDLAGYRIVYGTAPTSLTQTISVTAPITSYVVENLTPATWYFAIKAYNTAGAESELSSIASKSIP